jgi:hypothetical protein
MADKHCVARNARLISIIASLRGKLRYIYRAAKGRYKIQSEALIDKEKNTAKLRINLAHLSSDLRYSNALLLRLRAACVLYALHPINEFDVPSVRKNAQSKNTRVQLP